MNIFKIVNTKTSLYFVGKGSWVPMLRRYSVTWNYYGSSWYTKRGMQVALKWLMKQPFADDCRVVEVKIVEVGEREPLINYISAQQIMKALKA